MATHSPRVSSAPPPRCLVRPRRSSSRAPLRQARQSLSLCAHAGFPDAPRRRFPAVRDAMRGPLELHFDSLRSGSSRPQHTEPLPERSSSQAKTFCRIVLSMNRFPVSSSVLCSPSLGLADGAPPAPSSARSSSRPRRRIRMRGPAALSVAATSSLLKQDCTEQGVLAKPNLSAFGNFNWPGFT